MGGQGLPSYPPHGSQPHPHPNQSYPPSGAPPPRGGNNYFSDKKKGEGNELKNVRRPLLLIKPPLLFPLTLSILVALTRSYG